MTFKEYVTEHLRIQLNVFLFLTVQLQLMHPRNKEFNYTSIVWRFKLCDDFRIEYYMVKYRSQSPYTYPLHACIPYLFLQYQQYFLMTLYHFSQSSE